VKFSKNTTTAKEDPAIAAAREREQQRADAAYITNTQGLLDSENRRRARRFGRRIALSGANPAATPSASAGLPLMSSGAGGIAGYNVGPITEPGGIIP